MPEDKNPAKDASVRAFFNNYITSPKYKERLSGFYKYPDLLQQRRADQVANISIRENPGDASAYYPNGTNANEVSFSEKERQILGESRAGVLAHEISHATNGPQNQKPYQLSDLESNFIAKRNKLLPPSTLAHFQKLAKEKGTTLAEVMRNDWHDQNPSESKSDVDALRFLLKDRKLYDAGKADFTPDILNKAKKDPVIKKSFLFNRLLQNFDDASLIEIMNKIAMNRGMNKQNIA